MSLSEYLVEDITRLAERPRVADVIRQAASQERARPGRVREEQNWIGGRLGNQSDAVFVPPPEDLVVPLLEDLIAFIGREDLPGVPQAAIAHAQFETIHPFIDGNGRVGRALVHVILRRRGTATRFVPPLSIVLAARPAAYVEGLTAYREGRLADWIGSFSEAAGRAAAVSIELADQVLALQGVWRERAGRPRAGSAASRLIALLPAPRAVSADGPGGDRREPAADPRRPQGAGGRRCDPPAERRDVRPPVRGDRALRPPRGLRGAGHRPSAMR